LSLTEGRPNSNTEKKGNLVINTALELPNHDEDIPGIVRSAINRLEAFFRRMIDLGQARGAISEDIIAGDGSKSLVFLTVGLRVLTGRGQ